jgi:hypothetical protein
MFRKFSVGIYHTIKKKKERRNQHLYQDFQFCTSEHYITSYRTVRLGAPAKFPILHSGIGRRVDFSSYKKPQCSLDLCAMVESGPIRSRPIRYFKFVWGPA